MLSLVEFQRPGPVESSLLQDQDSNSQLKPEHFNKGSFPSLRRRCLLSRLVARTQNVIAICNKILYLWGFCGIL